MVRAKYVAQVFVGHTGLNMMAFQCNSYFVSSPVGQSLLRVTVPSQILNPLQPDAGYYVLRTVCTVMDDWKGVDFPVTFSGDKQFQVFTLARGENELMVAAWVPGNSTSDGIVEAKSDVTVPGIKAKKAWAVDLMNGTEQELNFIQNGNETIFKRMLIKDYPVLMRIAH